MISKMRKLNGVVAVLVVLSLTQVCVFGTPAASATRSSLRYGRLELARSQSVSLNGYEVNTGTTIVSGAQLRTPATVSATVQWDALGTLSIAPETDLAVTFGKDSINVVVVKGYAALATKDGVKGTVTMATTNNTAAPAPAAPQAPAVAGGLFGLGTAGTVAVVVVAVVATVFIVKAVDGGCDNNPTPFAPPTTQCQ